MCLCAWVFVCGTEGGCVNKKCCGPDHRGPSRSHLVPGFCLSMFFFPDSLLDHVAFVFLGGPLRGAVLQLMP